MRRATAVLLLAATAVEGARLPDRLPGLGPGLVRISASLAGSAARVNAPPTLPRDTNATSLFRTLQRDLIFIERLSVLLLRTASRAAGWLQRWFTRSIGYPPRVIVVEMSGIIAADDEVSSYRVGSRPELLSGDVEMRGGSDSIINLARIDRLVTKAFNAHGARAVCARSRLGEWRLIPLF